MQKVLYQKHKDYFKKLLEQKRLGHAYLFTGPNSVGKKNFAEDLCVLLTGKNFINNPDLKLLSPKTEEGDHKIYIEDVRDLKSFMSLKAYSGKYKLAVINNADTLTTEAANAMLKVLEEPPKNSVLILITSKPRLLPTTIISRCETVVFPPMPEAVTEEMNNAVAELRKVARQNIADRIKYAKQIYEKENYVELVNLWLKSLRLQLIDKPKSASVLKNLLQLSHIISQPQYNHRIALERFFINLH